MAERRRSRKRTKREKLDEVYLTKLVLIALQKGLYEIIGESATAINTRLIRNLSDELSKIIELKLNINDHIEKLTTEHLKEILTKQLKLSNNVDITFEEEKDRDVELYRFFFKSCIFSDIADSLREINSIPVICPVALLIAALLRKLTGKPTRIKYKPNPNKSSICSFVIELHTPRETNIKD